MMRNLYIWVVGFILLDLTTSANSDYYAKEIPHLKEFNNNYLDFRVYFCTGIFFKNKDKHEPAYTKIKQSFPNESAGKDPLIVSQKFMLSNIYKCLQIIKKYEPYKFYLKIREFAAPGNNNNKLNPRLLNRIRRLLPRS
jgi:hypothetical protein